MVAFSNLKNEPSGPKDNVNNEEYAQIMSLLDELEKEEQNITESDMDEEETNTTQAKVFQETISSGTEKLDMFYNSFGFVFVNLIPLLTLIVFFFKKNTGMLEI